jgi:hypothetical protein
MSNQEELRDLFIRSLADDDGEAVGGLIPEPIRNEARKLIQARWEPSNDPVHGGMGWGYMRDGFLSLLAAGAEPVPDYIRDEARKIKEKQ